MTTWNRFILYWIFHTWPKFSCYRNIRPCTRCMGAKIRWRTFFVWHGQVSGEGRISDCSLCGKKKRTNGNNLSRTKAGHISQFFNLINLLYPKWMTNKSKFISKLISRFWKWNHLRPWDKNIMLKGIMRRRYTRVTKKIHSATILPVMDNIANALHQFRIKIIPR